MWDEIYERHCPELLRYCLSAGLNKAAAEDLAQEAFLKALQNAATFEELGLSQQRAWLFRALKNLICDRYRRSILENQYIQTHPSEECALDPNIQEFENRLVLRKLAPEDQMLFALRYLEGYTAPEIAEMLGMPAGTIRSRLSRCRKLLKNIMDI